MAKVYGQVLGGSVKEVEVKTVGDVKAILDAKTHTATVNGNPQPDSYELKDYEVVNLAPAVKGA